MLRKLTSLALLLLLAAAAVACRPRIVVRLTTTAYHDSGLDRRLEVVGRTSDDEVPTENDWLAEEAGVTLAAPDAWPRVERGPGWLRAEGFFPSADVLPPLLSMRTESAVRPARTFTRLEIEDRVVLKRWTYVERHGDPFSAADSAAALEALVELAVEALTSELDVHFGGGVDSAPAQRLLRGDGRALTQALLTVNRSAPGWLHVEDRAERWTQVLAQYGVPVVPVDDHEDYWDVQGPTLLEWARERVADSLSTPEAPISAEDLAFWPTPDNFDERLSEIATRVWGSEDELTAEAEPLLAALVGYYGAGDIPRFRFESRVQIPGTLLKTNGTQDGDSVVWLFREQDLTFGEISLRSESVELNDDALVTLGARRKFDMPALVRLADLLFERDPEGVLVEPLTRAVAAGDLDLLREEDGVPDELSQIVDEVADLLDPTVPLESSGDV
jgi:hypothetical protein